MAGKPTHWRGANRRDVLRAGAAAGAALLLSVGAPAAAPFRFAAGRFELSVISDGHLVLPTQFLAPDIPAQERAAALASNGVPGDRYQAATNVTLIRHGSDVILVDAGSGPTFMSTAGRLVENLAAAGISPETVTKIVLTHGHPDHLWGIVDALDELAFPQASYVVAAAEWDFWTGEEALRFLPQEHAGLVTGARRSYSRIKDKLVRVKPGDDVVTGLRVVDTRGHTQGHVSLEIEGSALVTGDTLTHPVISFQHPQWRPASDHEPERASQTRLRLLDRLANEHMRVIGFHLPYPGVGAVEKAGGAYRFVAA